MSSRQPSPCRRREIVPGLVTGGVLAIIRPTLPTLTGIYDADLTDPARSWLVMRYQAYSREIGLLVHLATSRPRYGGLRWWFICPLEANDRPAHWAAKLFLPPGEDIFGSRHGHQLTYRSCQQGKETRRLLQAVRASGIDGGERLMASLSNKTT